MKGIIKGITKTTVLAGLLILAGSCAVFKGKVEMDMQPFSDNTAILFNEAVKVSRPFQFKSLATYTTIEEYEEIKQKSVPLIKALKGIVYYSNQVVAISNSKMTEKGKNEQLAIYLDGVLDQVEHKERMDSIGLTQAQIELTLKDIKQAENYREGILAAAPIVNTIVLAMFERLDEIESLIDSVIVSFDNQIYTDYQHTIANYLSLKELQNSTQKKLTQIYFAQSGNSSLVDSLIASDASLVPHFSNRDSITQENYDNAEAFLLKRLNNVDLMLRQLDDDKLEYIDMKEEISIWHVQVDEKISVARNSIIVWSQSHKNLGKGIEIPPLIGVETFIDLIQPAAKNLSNLIF